MLNRPKRTIQAAINAAAEGGAVVVDPGIYREKINFTGKAITVWGISGAAAAPVAAVKRRVTRAARSVDAGVPGGRTRHGSRALFLRQQPEPAGF